MGSLTLIELFEQMAAAGASDLHLCAGSPPVMRIRGDLIPLDQPVLESRELTTLIYKITTQAQQQTLEVERELDFSYDLGGKWRFRVNVFYDRDAVATAVRLVPAEIPTLDELYMPPILKELTLRRRGLILVTGPTGSGKSTTLAAMIDLINEARACHIITVEDPDRVHAQPQARADQPA